MWRFSGATLLLAAALLTACGGGGGDRAATSQTTPRMQHPAEPPPSTVPPAFRLRPGDPPDAATDPALAVPPYVPRDARGPVRRGEVAVILRWLKAVRDGRIASAARLFALPSKVQNDTPLVTLRTPRQRLAFNANLVCGAIVKRARGVRGYVVLDYVLTDRPGADCGSGAGLSARGVIRVRGGRITEWYRLWERVEPPSAAPSEARSGA